MNLRVDEPIPAQHKGLRWADIWLLVLLCVLLLGWGALCGRPLSMHEARLPELAREMVEGKSDYLLPLSGGRPWLERPPLPHWLTAGSMLLFGNTDAEWVARLPAALAGTAVVLLCAWIAAMLFGRRMGLLSGVVLVTTYELYTYSSLAEDDIYLAALAAGAMAMFVKAEQAPGGAKWGAIFGGRAWPVVLMFVLLGLTNLAKGPLVGALPVIGTIGVYLLWNFDRARWRRYLWPWGILIFLGLTVAWPLLALARYPDVWGNWRYDYTDHFEPGYEGDFDQPFWYYPMMMPMILAPWIWAAIPGLIVTARRAWRQRGSPERLLWCWAWMGLIALSLPARKHHHYFLPVIVPWAILAAQGLIPVGQFLFSGKGPAWTRRPSVALLFAGLPGVIALCVFRSKIPGPSYMPAVLAVTWVASVWLFYLGQWRRNGRLLMAGLLTGYMITAGWLQTCVVSRDSVTLAELQFLGNVRGAVPAGQPLAINAGATTLEFFRLQFYLPHDARLLQNLSYLRSTQIPEPSVYVISSNEDEPKLRQLGTVEVVLASAASHGSRVAKQHFVLYHLTFAPDAVRGLAPPPVSVMQAMDRAAGPWCGEPW